MLDRGLDLWAPVNSDYGNQNMSAHVGGLDHQNSRRRLTHCRESSAVFHAKRFTGSLSSPKPRNPIRCLTVAEAYDRPPDVSKPQPTVHLVKLNPFFLHSFGETIFPRPPALAMAPSLDEYGEFATFIWPKGDVDTAFGRWMYLTSPPCTRISVYPSMMILSNKMVEAVVPAHFSVVSRRCDRMCRYNDNGVKVRDVFQLIQLFWKESQPGTAFVIRLSGVLAVTEYDCVQKTTTEEAGEENHKHNASREAHTMDQPSSLDGTIMDAEMEYEEYFWADNLQELRLL